MRIRVKNLDTNPDPQSRNSKALEAKNGAIGAVLRILDVYPGS
jgi:hypothetical protein